MIFSPLGPALFGIGVGGALGLLGLQQCSHWADLPAGTRARCATQGSILLRAMSVVPQAALVAHEQWPIGLIVLAPSAITG